MARAVVEGMAGQAEQWFPLYCQSCNTRVTPAWMHDYDDDGREVWVCGECGQVNDPNNSTSHDARLKTIPGRKVQ